MTTLFDTRIDSSSTKLGHGGFSLVEIMIVLSLVGLALIPLSGIQFGSRRTVVAADRYYEAVTIAQENLEEMRASGFNNAVADTFVVNGFTIATSADPYLDPDTGVNLPSVEQLRVAVSWNDRGDTRTINLDCLQAER
jgi:prepilin-type N-terminal cleavage/methylation domain-containing protein